MLRSPCSDGTLFITLPAVDPSLKCFWPPRRWKLTCVPTWTHNVLPVWCKVIGPHGCRGAARCFALKLLLLSQPLWQVQWLQAGRCSGPQGHLAAGKPCSVCWGLSSAGELMHLEPPHVYIALWFPLDAGDPFVTEEQVEPKQSCLLSYSELRRIVEVERPQYRYKDHCSPSAMVVKRGN